VTAKIKIAVRMTDATRRLYTVDAADMPVEQMAELTRREVPAAHTVLIGPRGHSCRLLTSPSRRRRLAP
jgi:hypothetical protein